MRPAVPPSDETVRAALAARQATRRNRVINLVAGVVLVLALVFLIGALTACQPDDEFTRKCQAKGGVVHTTHRDGSTSRVCKPAPVPKPQPGWQ